MRAKEGFQQQEALKVPGGGKSQVSMMEDESFNWADPPYAQSKETVNKALRYPQISAVPKTSTFG